MASEFQRSAAAIIDEYLKKSGLQYDKLSENEWIVTLQGPEGRALTLRLTLGAWFVDFRGFVIRAPEENVADVYRFLLRKNLESRVASLCLNEAGDVFIKAELPLPCVSDEQLDRYLGLLFLCWEEAYGTVFRLGWPKYTERDGEHN